jgi:hypothetical protein
MKTFSTIFMGLVIIAGLTLALTPFIADKLFPTPKNQVRQAKPEAAAMALQQWFKSPEAPFMAVQAINKMTPTDKTSWFAFSVGRAPVEKYIIDKKLKQTPLSKNALDTVFYNNDKPASWWQPDAIVQQTYFAGKDQDRFVALLYSPDSKRGVLVTSTKQPSQ